MKKRFFAIAMTVMCCGLMAQSTVVSNRTSICQKKVEKGKGTTVSAQKATKANNADKNVEKSSNDASKTNKSVKQKDTAKPTGNVRKKSR